jgi:hypothetical protein
MDVSERLDTSGSPLFGLDRPHYLFRLHLPVLVGNARMFEVGFIIAGSFDSRRRKSRAVTAERLEEGARITAVLGTCPLISGIECPEFPIGPEVGTFPQIHQSEHALVDFPQTGLAVAFQKVQFLQSFEYPKWQVDLDAVRIEDLPVEIVRHEQSFAHQELVDFGAPARSRRIYGG